MATIRAAWKRVIQVKQFESETLELGSEFEIAETADPVENAQKLARLLAEAGDELVLERLKARSGAEETKPVARRPRNLQDAPPDPKIIAEIKKDGVPALEDPDAPDDYLNL